MTDKQINAAIADATGWTAIWGERCDPDYCNNLNEMHEAEKALTQEQITDYVIEVMQFSHEPMLSTARQRAEAFLRTLEKWRVTDKKSLSVGGATTEGSLVDHVRDATKMMEAQK